MLWWWKIQVKKPIVGGEFNFDPALLKLKDSPYSVTKYLNRNFENLSLFTSGRDAIYILIKKIRPRTVFLPNYICESIYKPIDIAKVSNIVFYPVLSDLSIDKSFFSDVKYQSPAIFFVMSYFGKVDVDFLEFLIKHKKNNSNIKIVIDVTHSLLDSRLKKFLTYADYSVGSLRKWFFLPDGGFISGKELIKPLLNSAFSEFWSVRAGACLLRYLGDNGFETDDDYEAIKCAESLLDKYDEMGYRISDLSRIIMNKIDVEKIDIRRRSNLYHIKNFIMNKITNAKVIFDNFNSPFTVPIIFDKQDTRNIVRNNLLNKGIICPIHWDTSWMHNSHGLSDRILSIPCDQRIGKYEIEYLKSMFVKEWLNA